MSVIQRTIRSIEERRNNAVKGRFNSIPSPFRRFSSQYVGIERGTYYLITASTKGGKTQLTSFLFIFTPLLFCYKYPSIDFRVIYFPFEETPERVTSRWISFLLYELHDIEVDYQTLMSTSNIPLEKSILNLINSEDIQKYLKFFEERVTFVEDEKNPTGIYKYMKNYAEENGTTYYTEYETKDDFGMTQANKKFSHYIPKNPNSYTLFIADHCSLVDCERGFTLKQSIDKLSEYCVLLRNRYNLSPVLVQQQAFNETADNFKQGLVRPTLTGLSDSKYCSRDKRHTYVVNFNSIFAT